MARWLIAVLVVAGVAGVPAAAGAADDSPYAGSDKCKGCHRAIHDAWAGTKHARALQRLTYAEQQKECLGCHVAESPADLAAKNNKTDHPNVQCEACHGAARAHAQKPSVKEGLTAKPGESVCTRCHNEKSPHYRGFVFAALKGFVHPVR